MGNRERYLDRQEDKTQGQMYRHIQNSPSYAYTGIQTDRYRQKCRCLLLTLSVSV